MELGAGYVGVPRELEVGCVEAGWGGQGMGAGKA